jgi:hypothetical protein
VAGFTESDRIRAFRNGIRAARLKLGTFSWHGPIENVRVAEKIAEESG